MSTHRRTAAAAQTLILVGTLTCGMTAWSQDSQQPQQPTSSKGTLPMGGTASTSKPGATISDRELTSKVRAAFAQDQTLAADAKHVKVAAKNGRVSLTGTVSTADAKANMEAKAGEIAGPDNVTSRLIAPKK